MKTGIIQIDNPNDKLTQQKWCEYITEVMRTLQNWHYSIRFYGASPSAAPWQNACWIFDLEDDERIRNLETLLPFIMDKYSHDGMSFIVGEALVLSVKE